MSSKTAIAHFHRIMRPVIELASGDYLQALRADLSGGTVPEAIRKHDTVALFDWISWQLSFQGISDRVAAQYDALHGGISWWEIERALESGPSCSKLASYWSFDHCGYRKNGPCNEPSHRQACPLPRHFLRKGTLNQTGYSLFLFIRDICEGDLVSWIDWRLAEAGSNPVSRAAVGEALISPIRNVYGTGDKLWNMILANLLLAGNPDRLHWVEAGASMIAIDTLVHNFLHRTGILHRFGASHPYGPLCYAPNGCASLIERFAREFECQSLNSQFPKYFPRFIQHAIWAFCSESGWNICNGRQINDLVRCAQTTCPVYVVCDRVPLHGLEL